MRILISYILLSFIILKIPAYSQNVNFISRIKGSVVDSATNDPLAFVSVFWDNSNNSGTLTDDNGRFLLTTKDTTSRIIISCVGYKTLVLPINVGKVQILTVKLLPEIEDLKAVVVKPRKEKYRNKGNPAVELIQKVIANKSKNRKEEIDFYSFEKYEKLQISLSDYSDNLRKNLLFKNFQFVFDNVDTSSMSGKKILPLFLKEVVADEYYLKTPEKKVEVIKAEKMVRFDEYANKKTISRSLQFLYQDINIYDNNISLLSNQFLSPLAPVAPAFYKFFIIDTSYIGSSKCINLAFFPRNKTDLLFQGHLYILLDSSYAVKKIHISTNKDINLNWVKELNIEQEFEKVENQGWILNQDILSIDFGVSEEKAGIFGQRTIDFRNYKFDKTKADSIIAAINKEGKDDIDNMNDAYWASHRFQPLSLPQQRIYSIMDSLKKVPSFRREMDATVLVSSGFIGSRNLFEFGPANTFYSYNPIEGSRFKLGGRTTPRFSRKFNFEVYGAYGLNDEKYKYYGAVSYSLTRKTVFDFPVKNVKISYQSDIKIPGQELQFAQENNFLFSIKRGINDKMYYNNTFKIEHLNEFDNHFSFMAGYEYTKIIPTGNLFFNSIDYLNHNNNMPDINISQINVNLRYAPHEQFIQGKIYRNPIANIYPVFQLQYSTGQKSIGSDYNYHRIVFITSKRFYFSFLGYTDMTLETGKVFGKVSYPLLDINRANQTYAYQSLSFNLMNYLEFVSDKHVSLYAQHCFNGFFLNKIPLIRELKLRELGTIKVLYGDLSNKNNPGKQTELLKFPVDMTGVPLTYSLGNRPYIEASVGISNILKLIRIDYVRRLSYLNHPNVSSGGLRVSLNFDF